MQQVSCLQQAGIFVEDDFSCLHRRSWTHPDNLVSLAHHPSGFGVPFSIFLTFGGGVVWGEEVHSGTYSQHCTLFFLNLSVLNFKIDSFLYSDSLVLVDKFVCQSLCCLLFCRLNPRGVGVEMRFLGLRTVNYIIGYNVMYLCM